MGKTKTLDELVLLRDERHAFCLPEGEKKASSSNLHTETKSER